MESIKNWGERYGKIKIGKVLEIQSSKAKVSYF